MIGKDSKIMNFPEAVGCETNTSFFFYQIQNGILLSFHKFVDMKAFLNTLCSRKKLIVTDIRHVG